MEGIKIAIWFVTLIGIVVITGWEIKELLEWFKKE